MKIKHCKLNYSWLLILLIVCINLNGLNTNKLNISKSKIKKNGENKEKIKNSKTLAKYKKQFFDNIGETSNLNNMGRIAVANSSTFNPIVDKQQMSLMFRKSPKYVEKIGYYDTDTPLKDRYVTATDVSNPLAGEYYKPGGLKIVGFPVQPVVY